MRYAKNNIAAILLIILGSASWSLTMVKSGLLYGFGMGFWGPNGHDGVWHIALINRLAKGSFEMPIFAGEPLRNYHWFYDWFLALIHRVTGVPAHTLYFQIFPPILAILVGWLTYKFVLTWRKSKSEAWWATFFVYFGGSWGWLVSFAKDGSFGGESMFWAQQAVSTLINPPYAASLVLLLLGMVLFLRYREKPTAKLLALLAVVFGVLIQIKAYAGVIALGGLWLAGFWDYWRSKNLGGVKIFLGASLVSLLVFLPTNRNAGSLLVFSPLWFPETMVAFGDRFPWPRLASAIASYKSGGNFLKLIPAEILALLIFWFGNLGTRVAKEPMVFGWVKEWRKLDALQVFILSAIGMGLVLPLLFIQQGNPWNTIQFLYYALFFSGILAGIALGGWLEKKRDMSHISIYVTRVILPVGLIVGLTLPTTLNTLTSHYLPGRPPAKVSGKELEALQVLKNQEDGVVLTYPFDPNLRRNLIAPVPLWIYETTSYVAAFSEKPVFLEDEMNLEITGYDWRPRRVAVERFFASEDDDFLKENNISYIYLVDGQKLPASPAGGPDQDLTLEEIYNQENVRIYRVL